MASTRAALMRAVGDPSQMGITEPSSRPASAVFDPVGHGEAM
jgi:hypothetical protein